MYLLIEAPLLRIVRILANRNWRCCLPTDDTSFYQDNITMTVTKDDFDIKKDTDKVA